MGQDGRPLLFLGVRGRQVSNDHYPYYEFLFATNSPGAPPTLLSSQRFYYDVAGIRPNLSTLGKKLGGETACFLHQRAERA